MLCCCVVLPVPLSIFVLTFFFIFYKTLPSLSFLWHLLLLNLSSVLGVLRRLFNLQGVLNCHFLLWLFLIVGGLLLVLKLLLIHLDLTLAELEFF